MDKRKQFILHISAVSAFCLLFAALALSLFIFPGLYPAKQIWKGYFTLVFPVDTDFIEINTVLREAGYQGIISAETELVEFNGFSEMETISAAALYDRFDSADPRFDSYMRKLPQSFTAETVEGTRKIGFVPVTASSLSAKLKIGKVLQTFDDRAMIADSLPLRGLLHLVCFFAITALLTLRFKKNWYLVVPGSLVWIQLIVSGNILAFFCAALLHFTWVILIDDLIQLHHQRLSYPRSTADVSNLRNKGLYYLLIAAIGIIVFNTGSLGELSPYALLPSIGGQAALSCAYGFWILIRKNSREHRIFIPLPIIKKKTWSDWNTGQRYFFPIVLLLILVPVCIAPFIGTDTGLALPVPEPLGEVVSFQRESLKILYQDNEQAHLPDIADYITHLSYQEGFMYGRGYQFPEEDERLYFSVFDENDGVIDKSWEIVREYDQDWISRRLSSLPDLSYEGMLYAQGRPVRVVFGTANNSSPGTTAVLVYMCVILLLFSPFIIPKLKLSAGFLYDMRTLESRRRRQAA
jgi:hypothetical protein